MVMGCMRDKSAGLSQREKRRESETDLVASQAGDVVVLVRRAVEDDGDLHRLEEVLDPDVVFCETREASEPYEREEGKRQLTVHPVLLARVDAVESRDDRNVALETVVNLRLRLRLLDLLGDLYQLLLIPYGGAWGARVAESELVRQRPDRFEVESSDGWCESRVAEDEDAEEGEGDEPSEADSGEARRDRSSREGGQWPVAHGGRKE